MLNDHIETVMDLFNGSRHLIIAGIVLIYLVLIGVRLENGKYPTLSLFFVQITSWVYGDS